MSASIQRQGKTAITNQVGRQQPGTHGFSTVQFRPSTRLFSHFLSVTWENKPKHIPMHKKIIKNRKTVTYSGLDGVVLSSGLAKLPPYLVAKLPLQYNFLLESSFVRLMPRRTRSALDGAAWLVHCCHLGAGMRTRWCVTEKKKWAS